MRAHRRTPLRTRWSVVLVRGASMLPALREGDCLVVRQRPVRPADVVVAELHGRPGLLVVKRAVRPVEGGWLLASDNASAPGAVAGAGSVQGVVVLRYWPLPVKVIRRRGRGAVVAPH